MSSSKYINLSSSIGGQNVLLFEFEKIKKFNHRLSETAEKSILNFPNHFSKKECLIPGDFKSVTCWSKLNLFELKNREFGKLQNFLNQCTHAYTKEFKKEYRNNKPRYATCWVNLITDYTDDIPPHRHHTNPFNIAGVYYASGDYSDGLGGIKFWTEQNGKVVTKEIHLKPGNLILFPSSLYHSISRYSSRRIRITFGFDIRFKKEEFYNCPNILLF